MGVSIQEIKKDWSDLDIEQKKRKIDELKSDSRKGVQTLVSQFEKELDRERERKELFVEMSKIESRLYIKEINTIGGIDEVGRGTLCGPVVASCVVLPKNCYIPGLNDSKKLSGKARERLFEEIQKIAVSIGVGVVEAYEIDEINIYQASKKAMMLAVEDLDVKPDYLLVDAMSLDLPIPQEAIIKGDAKSISIAAASVVAKEIRDRLMKELALEYPEYGFDQHMGYGTKQHLNAIKVHGICPEHRKSFSPIKEELN